MSRVWTISEVLAGKRQLSRGHIGKLAPYVDVSASGPAGKGNGGDRNHERGWLVRRRRTKGWEADGPCVIYRAAFRLYPFGGDPVRLSGIILERRGGIR